MESFGCEPVEMRELDGLAVGTYMWGVEMAYGKLLWKMWYRVASRWNPLLGLHCGSGSTTSCRRERSASNTGCRMGGTAPNSQTNPRSGLQQLRQSASKRSRELSDLRWRASSACSQRKLAISNTRRELGRNNSNRQTHPRQGVQQLWPTAPCRPHLPYLP